MKLIRTHHFSHIRTKSYSIHKKKKTLIAPMKHIHQQLVKCNTFS